MAGFDDQLSAQIAGAAFPMADEPADALPFYMDVLENIPGITTSMGNTARRGSSTILKGGRRAAINPKSSWLGQATRANIRPFRRYASQGIFFNQGLKGGIGYTPFNMAQVGNNFINALGGGSSTRFGKMGGAIGRTLGVSEKAAQYTQEGKFFAQGSLSRISAGMRISNMSEKFGRFDRLIQPPTSAMAANNSMVGFMARSGVNMGEMSGFARTAGMTHRQAYGMTMSATGGRIGGFMGAARAGYIGGEAAEKAFGALVGSNTAGRAGASLAATWAENAGLKAGYTARAAFTTAGRNLIGKGAGQMAGKVALGGAGKAALLGGAKVAGMMIPGLNILMTALLVKDLASIATAGVAAGARLAGDAYKSATGGMNTGPFQQSYKDTEAAATSRQRGVMAIQNSRLNGRSILGNEAGAMYQHFG